MDRQANHLEFTLLNKPYRQRIAEHHQDFARGNLLEAAVNRASLKKAKRDIAEYRLVIPCLKAPDGPRQSSRLVSIVSKFYTDLYKSNRRLFGLISNENLFNGQAVEERPPNRALYNSVLSRDLDSLILSKPNIPEQSKVIVLVCTKPNSFDIRMAIRETWANPLLSKAVNDNFVSVVFLKGTDFVGDSVKSEIQTSNDILHVDVHDSYSNLVYKAR
ncbi:hypothetical protein Q1695_014575 [Nippostrongylus brasiliensis]|nr:hypothetical protein Q1695_014575 [Nippostrongylus brasiliensis]